MVIWIGVGFYVLYQQIEDEVSNLCSFHKIQVNENHFSLTSKLIKWKTKLNWISMKITMEPNINLLSLNENGIKFSLR